MRLAPIALLLTACVSTPTPAPKAADAFPWLIGTWRTSEDGFTTEERWVRGPDGSLLGSGRVDEGACMGFAETLSISHDGQRFAYVAWPARQEPVVFLAADDLDASRLVFENPGHDFPQRFVYTRSSPTTLEVQATGTGADGAPRADAWTLERAL